MNNAQFLAKLITHCDRRALDLIAMYFRPEEPGGLASATVMVKVSEEYMDLTDEGREYTVYLALPDTTDEDIYFSSGSYDLSYDRAWEVWNNRAAG